MATATGERLRSRDGVRTGIARVRKRIEWFRLREHLRRTERALRRADVSDRSPERRRRRRTHLDRLRTYWQRGQFPTAPAVEGRAPRFVGANGVPCALAYLLREDGREDLVDRVASERNDVRVEDVEEGPILDWADRNGFTKAAAARIQPTYTSHGVELADTCGPIACGTARLIAGLVGVLALAALEYVGYRVASTAFPDNSLKAFGTFAYFTAVNMLIAPLVAVVAYALFP